METSDPGPPNEILRAWNLGGGHCSLVSTGHINRTYRVDHLRGRFLLQRMNRIFSPEVHHDIEAVTERVESTGMITPRLVRTASRDLWTVDTKDSVWRLFTFIEGETLLQADSVERCRQAGRLLGRFHRALWGFEHTFRPGRLGVHDTAEHLRNLEITLFEKADHPRFGDVEPLGREILLAARSLDLERSLPLRVVHGDPKISNFLFAPDGEAICLVDLDTIGRMPIAVELGDAFRSWCSPLGEEAECPFDLDFFRAGLEGYAGAVGGLPGDDERRAIPLLTETIAVELAARFAADALNERYFGWDRSRFERSADHNLLRARSQVFLARSIRKQRREMENLVTRAWIRGG